MGRVLPTLLLGVSLGCASGGGGGTGPRGNVDAGPRRDTGPLPPGTDGGPVVRPDAGGMCSDDSYPDECEAANDLGSLAIGDEMTVMGFLPQLADQDWFTVAFPPTNMPGMFGGGTPSLTLDGDETMAFEVRADCMRSVTCGEGTPRELLEYSFTDDQSTMMSTDEGEGPDYDTRDAAWPETLLVRVARRGGPATCAPYTLTISR